MPSQNRWFAEEDSRLLDLIRRGLSSDVIAIRLGRSVSSVRNRAKRLGLGFGRLATLDSAHTPSQ